MWKAILAAVVTAIVGLCCAMYGNSLNGFGELGAIAAIAIMGGFIIYFNEKKK